MNLFIENYLKTIRKKFFFLKIGNSFFKYIKKYIKYKNILKYINKFFIFLDIFKFV